MEALRAHAECMMEEWRDDLRRELAGLAALRAEERGPLIGEVVTVPEEWHSDVAAPFSWRGVRYEHGRLEWLPVLMGLETDVWRPLASHLNTSPELERELRALNVFASVGEPGKRGHLVEVLLRRWEYLCEHDSDISRSLRRCGARAPSAIPVEEYVEMTLHEALARVSSQKLQQPPAERSYPPDAIAMLHPLRSAGLLLDGTPRFPQRLGPDSLLWTPETEAFTRLLRVLSGSDELGRRHMLGEPTQRRDLEARARLLEEALAPAPDEATAHRHAPAAEEHSDAEDDDWSSSSSTSSSRHPEISDSGDDEE